MFLGHACSERTVGVQQNAFHFVATPRHNIPAPIGGVIWMGCDDQSLAVRFPAYTVSTKIPETWMETAEQNRTVFKMRSSHWAFNLIANLAYTRWTEITPVVQQRIVSMERKFADDLRNMDAAAIEMFKRGKPTVEVIEVLTNFTVEAGDWLIDECKFIVIVYRSCAFALAQLLGDSHGRKCSTCFAKESGRLNTPHCTGRRECFLRRAVCKVQRRICHHPDSASSICPWGHEVHARRHSHCQRPGAGVR